MASRQSNRYYDWQLGRFITRDPIGYDGGWNLYEYVGGNPVGNTDPSGLVAVLQICVSETNRPTGFDLDRIEALMQQALTNAGINDDELPVILSTCRHADENLGWQYDRECYYQHAGVLSALGLGPAIVGAHDAYTYLVRKPIGFNLNLQFSNSFNASDPLKPLAATPDDTTTVFNENIDDEIETKRHANPATFDKEIMWANILLHETIYIGALGSWDAEYVWGRPITDFNSAEADLKELIKLQDWEAHRIIGSFFLKGGNW